MNLGGLPQREQVPNALGDVFARPLTALVTCTCLLLSVTVETLAQDRLQIQRDAERWVRTQVAQEALSLGVSPSYIDITARVPRGVSQVEPCNSGLIFRFANDMLPWRQRTVSIECTSDEQHYRFRVDLEVTVHAMVWASRYELPRNHVIEASDIVQRSFALDRIYREFLNDQALIVGFETIRRIRAGEVFQRGDLKARTLVRRGDEVIVRLRNTTGMTIEMVAVAMTDGVLGETIELRNLSSGAIMEAVITGRNEAEKM